MDYYQELNIQSCSQAETVFLSRHFREPETLIKEIPPVQIFRPRENSDFYGAESSVRRAIGLDMECPLFTPAEWMHGGSAPWNPPIAIEEYTTRTWLRPKRFRRILVHNEVDRQFFASHKYFYSSVVGSPFIYAKPRYIQRTCTSRKWTLIMPAHQLSSYPDIEGYKTGFLQLVEKALTETSRESTLFCLHESEADRPWVTELLETYQISWVRGAQIDDYNSLSRIYYLLNNSKVMVTNTLGAHVLQSWYCKTPVGLLVTENPYPLDSLVHDPLFNHFDSSQRLLKKASLFHTTGIDFAVSYGMVSNPWLGVLKHSLALQYLGAYSQVTFSDLAKLLGIQLPLSANRVYDWYRLRRNDTLRPLFRAMTHKSGKPN